MPREVRELTTKDGKKRWELRVNGLQYAVVAPWKGRRYVLWTAFDGVPEGVVFKDLNSAIDAALDLERQWSLRLSPEDRELVQERIAKGWRP